MSTARCVSCGSSFDKQTVDKWNTKQADLDPVNQRHPNTSNCPICYSSRELKVWRYEG